MTNAHRFAAVCAVFVVLASACSPPVGDTKGESAEVQAPPAVVDEVIEPAPPANIGFPPTPPDSQFTPPEEVDPDPELGLDPVIEDITPSEASAQGGQIVTVHGQRFQPGVEVHFGDFPATDIFYIDSEWLNVTTPIATPGPVEVTVINPDGTEGSLDGAFRFVDDMMVETVEPAIGHPLGGTLITVTGAGFAEGSVVLIGDRLAVDVQIENGSRLTALTPPGPLGLADVRVVLEGEDVGVLQDAFTYRGAPEVASTSPPYGPTVGGVEVQLIGRWFGPDLRVYLDDEACDVTWVSPDGTLATAITPGGSAGPVDVRAVDSDGEGSLKRGYTYVPTPDGMAVFNVTPGSGSAAGGYTVLMVTQGIDVNVATTVQFGNEPSPSVVPGPWADTLLVEVPPGQVGWVPISVGQSGTWVSFQPGFTYLPTLELDALEPGVGPAEGGAAVSLLGAGFAADGEISVRFGAYDAAQVTVANDSQLVAFTPPCSPGLYDVTVSVGDRTATLANGFECLADGPAVFAVDPPEIAQSGGSLFKIIGADLPEELTVTLGGEPATEVLRESSSVVWARAPRGEAGTAVDLAVQLSGEDQPRVVPEAVLYFDPANKKAGVWGPRIDRTINLSVFDNNDGSVVPGATGILGHDPNTPHQCKTDDRGQCSISFHELVGSQQITASKYQFSAHTIAGFGGTNVTIYIREQAPQGQTGPPGEGGVEQPPTNVNSLLGQISGKVIGIGKYVKLPPPDCNVSGSPDGQQCTQCSDVSPCAGGLACEPIAATGSWCVKACEADVECNSGFRCQKLGTTPKCVPDVGSVHAECETSRRSYFGTNPDPGLGRVVDLEKRTYDIQSRLGEVTVFCKAGYRQPNGLFVPTIMGIRPTIVVALDTHVKHVDVELNIPLTRALRTRVFDTPRAAGGTTPINNRHAMDIGAEGWIPFAEQPNYVIGELQHYLGYPESLEPFGPDAQYTFYSSTSARAHAIG